MVLGNSSGERFVCERTGFSNNSITFALNIRVAVLIGVETASDVGGLLYHGMAVLAAVSGNVAFLRRHWCSARLMSPEAE